MSADCTYVIRNICLTDNLKKDLVEYVRRHGRGITFNPVNNLVICHQLNLGIWDIAFSPSDSLDFLNSVVDLLDCGIDFDGKSFIKKDIKDKVSFFCGFTGICLDYTEEVELYISEDNSYLPDYSVFDVEIDNLSGMLMELLGNVTDFLPNLYLRIRKTADRPLP